jgi:uncharacterized membrane protein
LSQDIPETTSRLAYIFAIRHRPRLLAGVAIALIAYFAVGPFDLREATRALIAWNAGAWTFLALIAQMMASESGRGRPDALAEDEGRTAVLLLSVLAATAAFAAIVWELGPVKSMAGFNKDAHIVLVACTVLSAWAFIHTSFALHYAGAYFTLQEDGEPVGGFNFPSCNSPGWTEFVYQAFVIGCACATADVNVTTSEMRPIVLVQGAIAFIFNTLILALTINVASGFF